MRTADADILILAAAGDGHWANRWAGRLPTARRIEGAPLAEALVAAAGAARRPVVIVAHDVGVLAVIGAGASLAEAVAGAFLVAAAPVPPTLRPQPLPFPAALVASRDDPRLSYEASEALARALGAELVDAGASGHLDEASGHGPWPEGLMRFAGFLKGLHAEPEVSRQHARPETEA